MGDVVFPRWSIFQKNVGMLCNFHQFVFGHPCLKTGAVGDVAFLRRFIFQKEGMLCNLHEFFFGHLGLKTGAVSEVTLSGGFIFQNGGNAVPCSPVCVWTPLFKKQVLWAMRPSIGIYFSKRGKCSAFFNSLCLDTFVQKQLPWAMWRSFGDIFYKNAGMLCNFHLFLFGDPCLKTGAVGDVAFLRRFIFQKEGMLCNLHEFFFGHLGLKTGAVSEVTLSGGFIFQNGGNAVPCSPVCVWTPLFKKQVLWAMRPSIGIYFSKRGKCSAFFNSLCLDTFVQKQLPWAMWRSFGDIFYKNAGMLCNFHLFLFGDPCLKTGAVGDVAIHKPADA